MNEGAGGAEAPWRFFIGNCFVFLNTQFSNLTNYRVTIMQKNRDERDFVL
jgi:hypothetical protein